MRIVKYLKALWRQWWRLCWKLLPGALTVLLIGFVVYLRGLPELELWHSIHLDEEFTTQSPVDDFAGYLALEDRLFQQLDERIYQALPPANEASVQRYRRGSLSDPGNWPRNWNRSFQMLRGEPDFGILLIHGMSDSPYLLKHFGDELAQQGGLVIGLRVPGHGTIPSGLVRVQWEDMAAAVGLAMEHLQQKLGERPLYILGFSNGGALALHHTLSSLENDAVRTPERMVLMSPEIAITELAVMARWQTELGHLIRQPKLYWNSIIPEYDPFKYTSFAVNAAEQARRITLANQDLLDRLATSGALERMPPVLAFQSVVDGTVVASALIEKLLQRLPTADNALVLFDINQYAGLTPLLNNEQRNQIAALLDDSIHPFDLTVISNVKPTSREVHARHRERGSLEVSAGKLCLNWPEDVYSLAHIALATPPQDSLYGNQPDTMDNPGLHLGMLAARGEYGILKISAADMLRMRWNPFYPYAEHRIMQFLSLPSQWQPPCTEFMGVLSRREQGQQSSYSPGR